MKAWGLGFLTLAAGLGAAQAASPVAAPISLLPHRIAYEVALAPRSGSSFSSASGLIVVEFTGNACAGYTTQFRQAMNLTDPDGASRMLDFAIRNWEGGKGERFRFTVLNKINGATTRDARGEAKRVRDGSISVQLELPPGKKGDFDGNALFPTAMLRDLVQAAQRGERRLDARVFDGSEGGERVFETVSTIGGALQAGNAARVEPVLQTDALKDVARWPVSTAYFEMAHGDRAPLYTMRNITYANGVVGDLAFDFPDFSLSARAVRFEPLPDQPCTSAR